MAVQDGYGKVSGSESLVFAYDLKDAINSYRGEPATNSQNGDISAMTQSGFDSWSCYDGAPPYHTWGTNQSKTFVTISGPFGTSVNAMLYHNFNGGFYGPTDWGAVPNGTITAGRTYTVQGWVKAADSASIGKQVSPYTYYSHSSGAYSNGTSYTLTDQWQLVSHTHTVQYNATSGGIMYFFTQNSGEVKMYLTMTGVFLDKSHSVPWIIGGSSRSSTQGLLDLTTNSTVNISGVSFNSSAVMTFDGSDDKIDIAPPNTVNVNTGTTIVAIIRKTSTGYTGQKNIISYRNGSTGGNLYIGSNSGAIFSYYDTLNVPYHTVGTIPDNQYVHIVVRINNNGSISHFSNGSLAGTTPVRTGFNPDPNNKITIGSDTSTNEFFQGDIAVFKHYNTQLSDTEILNDYLKYKRQYGLT